MPEVTPKLAKQHPVPQHITAFEFKLIGDLTIKQFIFAAVGAAIAYAAFVSNLNLILKWLIIFSAATLGLGSAFLPIQDRTLDTWLINFIRAILSPTQRVWKKEPLPPEFLREDYSQFLTLQVLSMASPQRRKHLAEYLKTSLEAPTLLEEETEFLQRLNFKAPLPKGIKVEEKPSTKKEEAPPPKKPFIKNITPGRKIRIPTIEGTIKIPPLKKKLGPPKTPIKVTKIEPPTKPTIIKKVIQEVAKEKKTTLIPFPETGRPNTIRGVIKNSQGHFLEGAVVIVKDKNGDPVRALKTNKLGQFSSTTPLENGEYTIEISARGRSFAIMKIVAEGKEIAPLEFKERYAGS